MKKTDRYKFIWSNPELVVIVNDTLAKYNVALTLRQVYYQLVAMGLMNAKKVYKNLSGRLSRLREKGLISWDKIIDLQRQPQKVSSWTCPESFFETVGRSYKRDLQQEQLKYTEVWCEKAAVISQITNKYDVNLLAGGGYRSSSALYEAAERFKDIDKPIVILYLGDFDPSGMDIERDIKERMGDIFGVDVDVQRILLVLQDITDYKLLPNPVKKKDPRTRAYIAKYGFDDAFELDALPPNIITERLEKAICGNMDMDLYKTQLAKWEEDKEEIAEFIEAWSRQQSHEN